MECELCGQQRPLLGDLLRQVPPEGGERPNAELCRDRLAVARDEVIRRGAPEHFAESLPHDLRLALFAAGRQKPGNLIRRGRRVLFDPGGQQVTRDRLGTHRRKAANEEKADLRVQGCHGIGEFRCIGDGRLKDNATQQAIGQPRLMPLKDPLLAQTDSLGVSPRLNEQSCQENSRIPGLCQRRRGRKSFAAHEDVDRTLSVSRAGMKLGQSQQESIPDRQL